MHLIIYVSTILAALQEQRSADHKLLTLFINLCAATLANGLAKVIFSIDVNSCVSVKVSSLKSSFEIAPQF